MGPLRVSFSSLLFSRSKCDADVVMHPYIATSGENTPSPPHVLLHGRAGRSLETEKEGRLGHGERLAIATPADAINRPHAAAPPT